MSLHSGEIGLALKTLSAFLSFKTKIRNFNINVKLLETSLEIISILFQVISIIERNLSAKITARSSVINNNSTSDKQKPLPHKTNCTETVFSNLPSNDAVNSETLAML